MNDRRRPIVKPPFDGQKGRCCWCGTALKGRQRRWCGNKACVDAYLIARGDQGRARARVIERDQGKCMICSKVCAKLEERPRRDIYTGKTIGTIRNWFEVEKWEADHVVPIAEGGALTLENLRTLCVPCHRDETRKLHARLAAARREARREAGGLPLFGSQRCGT